MKKISPINSTTVRSFVRLGIQEMQQHVPGWVAWMLRSQFTRTNPVPVPRLGIVERPQHQWEMRAEGGRLRGYSWGASLSIASRVALVSHGWNSNAFRLYPLIESLRQQGFTVVALDHLGHGASTGRHASLPQFARSLRRVARSLPRLDLFVGHSMGGAAGALALSQGMSARAAVLLAPPADVRDYVRRFATAYGLSSEVAALLQEDLELREHVELDQLVPEVMAVGLKIPALVVCDQHDREVPLEASRRYVENWAGAEWLVTEQLGHNRILHDPQVLSRIGEFVSQSLGLDSTASALR